MEMVDLAIPDVKLLKPRRFNDGRGFFQQTFQQLQYAEAGINVQFVQDNWSRSSKGVLRGLHYQHEHSQAKLVSVMRGEVFDVVVDMRRSSPTFGKWVGEILSAENGHQLFVPKGFAHAFLVLSDVVDFIYKCDDYYTPGDEYGVIWNDPEVGIEWPDAGIPLVSEKDEVLPTFAVAKYFD
ncbi:dTDP-4-dehydrorhamnose 3,5-epimerase [Pontiella sulfatireligans]|uniref:dTDP-4-dehydrorhamnose 3,5-epimerase n=1 Tax=Pontiella sulfatireligans TaxID=2750658 RepID=A0A6C2UFU5_9BACT|nr:dTDP-4-dehydrorhamnose 3,5-epimerase [Pontiella sulfatireligans]VGO18244.1 dTDP-4-dehydrorhamnose 3,5-epimerase [Pontiella sulfatireligans]